MTQRLLAAATADYGELQEEMRWITDCSCVQEAAQRFVEMLYGRFSDSLVLLRLFVTPRYDELPDEDRLFVDERGRATNTSHLIHAATPIFTLLGTRGARPEWNDRRASAHFRCIPLASTVFVASLSMLSRQFESVGLDLGLIDDWESTVASVGRADHFRGVLHIRDAAADRDSQGRMIVPKQDFVAAYGVKSVFGFGSGYVSRPVLVTLFAFTREELAEDAPALLTDMLEQFTASTDVLARQGRFF